MLSVKDSRRFFGGPISLRTVAQLERRTFPVSIRDLVVVDTRVLTGHSSAGDVSSDVSFTFASNGSWAVIADLHDDGTFLGDSYLIELSLNGTPGIGASFSGDLAHGGTMRLTESGIDPFLRNHFDEVHSMTVRLAVSPDIETVATIVFTTLFIGGVVLFFAGPGKVVGGPCPDAFVDNQPCYRFRKVPEGEPTIGGGAATTP